MKLETLEKNNKKKMIIGGLIGLSLVSAITLTTTRAKYRSTQMIKLAEGTVNFKSPDLELVAIQVSEDGTNYANVNTLPTDGTYEMNTEKSKCRIPTDTLTGENAPVTDGVSIEYTDGKINVLGMTTRNTRCYLYFDKKQGRDVQDLIASLDAKADVPDFTQVATTDEGVYITDDPMYATTENPNPKTYYWRGAATTNYVQFAGKCWRIIRINGDGTIRLIYDGTICHANGTSTSDSIVASRQVYNSIANNSSYVGWTYTVGKQRPSNTDSTNAGDSSGIKIATETWFNNDAGFTAAQKEQVAEGKFCNDRRTQNNEDWRENGSTQYYAAYQRSQNSSPTLDCLTGDTYTLKVGAITVDEVMFAGAKETTKNTSYYLYNGQYYWTMSPDQWNSGGNSRMFRVSGTDGSFGAWSVHNATNMGARPVINLKADTTFNSGSDGTKENPYVVQ